MKTTPTTGVVFFRIAHNHTATPNPSRGAGTSDASYDAGCWDNRTHGT